MHYRKFFRRATGIEEEPFPYQIRLAKEDWPELLDIPTGLGKTASTIPLKLSEEEKKAPAPLPSELLPWQATGSEP